MKDMQRSTASMPPFGLPQLIRSWLWRLTLACMVLASPLCGTEIARADVPADYLVQMVCDNGAGGHTAADPITCPGSARKLQIGEALPYHKWDGSSTMPGGQLAEQISDSYPIADLYGRTRVMATFYFDRLDTFDEPTFDGADPAYQKSAYDLYIADGNYISAAGTYDVGRGWQPIWANSSCSLADSWIFFPKNGAFPFGAGSATTHLQIAAPQCPTVVNFGTSLTAWNYYPAMSYESGKQLNTIKSFHFSANSVNADAIEEFYFTKEYGKTRWEAWRSSAYVSGPNANAVLRCPTGTSNGIAVFGSTTYYLQDCHDWSFIFAAPNGDWDPATHWHVDPLYNSQNLLTNTHAQCTASNGQAQDCTAGGVCQTIAPWGRYGSLNWLYYNWPGLSATANCELHFSIPNAWTGLESIYNDAITVPAGYTNYTYGAQLSVVGASSATALVRVFQEDSGYNVLTYSDFVATATTRRGYFQGAFTKLPNTAHMRLQVYPMVANVDYRITDSWIAATP